MKSTCNIVFSCSWWFVVEILQVVHEVSSFPEVPYKRGVLKNCSKFTDKHKKQSSGDVLSKDVLKNFTKFTEKYLWRSLFNKVSGWKSEAVRSSRWRWSLKQPALKNYANFTGKNLCWSHFLIQFWGRPTLLKKTRHGCSTLWTFLTF